MATPTVEELQTEADEHQARIAQLQAVRTQAATAVMPRFGEINKNYAIQWKAKQNKLLGDIDKKIGEAHLDRTAVGKTIEKLYPTAKPLTEAGQLVENERRRKEALDQQTQKPQADLAKNQLEQQKAADAASKVALGVGDQSLRDLLASGATIKRDEKGNYVFTQDNTGAKLTPLQAAKSRELAAGLAKAGITSPPESVFSAGAPEFDKKTGMSVPTAAFPFVVSRGDYNALAKTYEQSKPPESIDLVVPARALNKAYEVSAPAYGASLPENPVLTDSKTPAAVALAGMGKPGEAGYIPPSAQARTQDALLQGYREGVDANLSSPVSFFGGRGGSMGIGAPTAPAPVASAAPTPVARAKAILGAQTLQSGGLAGGPSEIAARFKEASKITDDPKEQAEIVAANTADQNAKEADVRPALGINVLGDPLNLTTKAYQAVGPIASGLEYAGRAGQLINKVVNPITAPLVDYNVAAAGAIPAIAKELYSKPAVSPEDVRKQYLEARRTKEIGPEVTYEEYAAPILAPADSSQDLPIP